MSQKTHAQKRKIVTKMILGTTYIAFIGYLLAELQWIADWNYNTHEILYVPYSIAIYFVPVLFLLWMYYAIKSKRELNENNKLGIRKILIHLMLFASLILVGAYF